MPITNATLKKSQLTFLRIFTIPAQHNDKLFLGRVSAVRLIVPEVPEQQGVRIDCFLPWFEI